MSVQTQAGGVGTLAHLHYTGYASDLKPVPTVDDASFFELDTRRVFVWKDREWRIWNDPAHAPDETNKAILAELVKIRRGLEMVLHTELPGD